jgi:DMSO/TMAO reductase YedYZ molybdopterin-dependent catalytic subunit
MRDRRQSRRGLLKGALASLGGFGLAGCDGGANDALVQKLFKLEEMLTLRAQGGILGPDALAREYTEADITKFFKPNGSTDPSDDIYKALAADGFKDFKLVVDGLVDRPGQYGLAELRAMPSRTQITRHDCVEGWSCIGQWSGVRVSHILDTVGVRPEARYVVFHCADTPDEASFGEEPAHFYGSIDLQAARHAQTILAYDFNGAPLEVPHGAPLRLRVERQLGYKMSKYVMRVELVESFAQIGDGHGGYWEDNGYTWYAGI